MGFITPSKQIKSKGTSFPIRDFCNLFIKTAYLP